MKCVGRRIAVGFVTDRVVPKSHLRRAGPGEESERPPHLTPTFRPDRREDVGQHQRPERATPAMARAGHF